MELRRKDPKFSASCQLEVEGLPAVTLIFEGERPKELMDQYAQIVGNGLAGVSVSTDMGIKKFGSGASAMVTISLTCNQDQNTLMAAADLAAQMGRHYVKQYQGQAEAELRQMLVSQGRQVEF